MKKKFLGSVGTMCLFAVSIASPALAAELLDVKPIMSGSNVMIEVTADIPMTYTYYKVPGQARAVVDIADADPEKVEPLIVVNKGSISSISVDKAMIADMTVSRLVFNLVSESDISVKQDADRKKLIVSFGNGQSAVAEPVTPVAVISPEPVPEPMAAPKPSKAVAVSANKLSKEEEDPLGLDDSKSVAVSVPVVAPEPKQPVAVVSANKLTKEDKDPLGLDDAKPVVASAPVEARSAGIEPVVPAAAVDSQTQVVVKGIVIGSTFIDIQTNGSADKIKNLKLTQPARIAIDIPGVTTMTKKSISVNKFGITKVRIGTSPGSVRIVLDTTKSHFPDHSIELTDTGVRINFK